MKTVTLIYPRTEGARFNAEYYVNSHMKMLIDEVGDQLQGLTVDIGEGPGSPFATLRFVVDSIEAVEAAMAPHNAKFQGDIPNYTDVTPQMHVSDLAMNLAGKGA